jgi:hypothetical protein
VPPNGRTALYRLGSSSVGGHRSYEPDGRQESADIVVKQTARNSIAEFTTCEYSHCCLSVSQFSGAVVQLSVAWLAGKVQRKKMASIRAKQSAADMANQNGHCCERTTNASRVFTTRATGQSSPRIAHP